MKRPPTHRAAVLLRMAATLAGPTLDAQRWGPPVPPEAEPVASLRLSADVALHVLPVGHVALRPRHVELERELWETEDAFRFPLMLADDRSSAWLPCYAYVIEHPEGAILIDTGESPAFGTRSYFAGTSAMTRRIYRRIARFRNGEESSLPARLAEVGLEPVELRAVVLSHLHSDHVGNVDTIPEHVPILVHPRETTRVAGTGRLVGKLPRTGQVELPDVGAAPWRAFDRGHPLTARQDVWMIPTPGHTIGHASVILDLGERLVVLAGDAAFGDTQIARDAVPGIVERRDMLLDTYARLRALAEERPYVALYGHDASSARLLARDGHRP